MTILKYIFFSYFVMLYSFNVFANNSYVIAKNEYEDIKNNFENVEEIVINLTINDELIVDRKVLEYISKKNKKLTYNIYKSNEIIYSFFFDGNYFNEKYNSIDLGINFDVYIDDYINKIFKDSKKVVFKTNYKGYFPNGTKLSIKNNFNKQNIYYISDDNIKKLNHLNRHDYISFDIEKGSKYIISSKEIINSSIIYMYITIIFIIILELVVYIFVYKK